MHECQNNTAFLSLVLVEWMGRLRPLSKTSNESHLINIILYQKRSENLASYIFAMYMIVNLIELNLFLFIYLTFFAPFL